LNNLNLTF